MRMGKILIVCAVWSKSLLGAYVFQHCGSNKSRGLRINVLFVLHHSSGYIFYFLWDHRAHSGYYENRIPLKPMVRSVWSLVNHIVARKET